MSKIVALAKEQIENIIYTAAKSAMSEGLLPEAELTPFKIEMPQNRDHGDYAVNAAMIWSKLLRNNPRKIAETLTERFDFSGSYIKIPRNSRSRFYKLFHCRQLLRNHRFRRSR